MWQKALAILGIICAFPFLLTIPGWVAIGRYRKWKSGEKGAPFGLMVWGVVVTCLVIIGAALPPSAPETPGNPPVVVQPGDTAGEDSAGQIGSQGLAPAIGQCGIADGRRVQEVTECDLAQVTVIAIEPLLIDNGRKASRDCPETTDFWTKYDDAIACWVELTTPPIS